MGIRDFTHYGWKNLKFKPSYNASDIVVDSSGTVYALWGNVASLPATSSLILEKSTDFGVSWSQCDMMLLSDSGGVSVLSAPAAPKGRALFCDNNDNIYYAGVYTSVVSRTNSLIRRSLDRGITWQTVFQTNMTNNSDTFKIVDMVQDSTNTWYCLASSGSSTNKRAMILSSSTGASGTWGIVDAQQASGTTVSACIFLVSSGSTKFYGQTAVSGATNVIAVRSGSGASGTWGFTDYVNPTITVNAYQQAYCDDVGNVFYTHVSGSGINGGLILRKSVSGGASGSWVSNTIYTNGLSDPTQTITFLTGSTRLNSFYLANYFATFYATHSTGSGISQSFSRSYTMMPFSFALDQKNAFVYYSNNNYILRGIRTANSSSIGPSTFAPSFQAALNEFTGSFSFGIPTYPFTNDGAFLANVSEFPHSQGLWQMKNTVLGTLSSGKIGSNENAIIQVKHIGSTVQIMWPRQINADSSVKGYGDLSVGQSVGKLTNTFDPGDFIDVTEFDHMSLYCYLRKQASGTLDDVVIQIERKPLTNIGFTTEQTVAYSTSGSFTEARLRDLLFKKQIDYGDLSITEIGYPIDIPLTNIKQVRISARHASGQVDDKNKNLVVYGRFIKSSKDTNET